jgi:hypothetical protein
MITEGVISLIDCPHLLIHYPRPWQLAHHGPRMLESILLPGPYLPISCCWIIVTPLMPTFANPRAATAALLCELQLACVRQVESLSQQAGVEYHDEVAGVDCGIYEPVPGLLDTLLCQT